MPQTYENADGAEEIAQGLVRSFHPHLATAKMRFIHRETASKKGGKVNLGTVTKMSDKMKFLIDADFLFEIPLDQWNPMVEATRTALIDHLLERCVGEEDKAGAMAWKTREPDVHEFSTILRRHGAWNEDLAGFVSVGKEIDLSFLDQDQDVVADGAAQDSVGVGAATH